MKDIVIKGGKNTEKYFEYTFYTFLKKVPRRLQQLQTKNSKMFIIFSEAEFLPK